MGPWSKTNSRKKKLKLFSVLCLSVLIECVRVYGHVYVLLPRQHCVDKRMFAHSRCVDIPNYVDVHIMF